VAAVWTFLRRYPASLYVTALGGILGAVESFGGLSVQQAGWVTAIVLGVGTITSAFLARPPHLAVISGGAAELLSGLTLFNLHVSHAQQGHIEALVTIGVTFITGMFAMHPNLTPRVGSAPAPSRVLG
jgi:hypothetical protein